MRKAVQPNEPPYGHIDRTNEIHHRVSAEPEPMVQYQGWQRIDYNVMDLFRHGTEQSTYFRVGV